jgi:SPP1 family predicted phage head-tail adaptor
LQTTFRPEIRTGQLRKRITIQQETMTPDGSLGFVAAWSTFRACWAAVEPLSGAERLQYAQLYPTLSIRVTVRYTKGVSPKMRILYGTRTLEILDVLDLQEQHKELQLMCHELGVA